MLKIIDHPSKEFWGKQVALGPTGMTYVVECEAACPKCETVFRYCDSRYLPDQCSCGCKCREFVILPFGKAFNVQK